MAKFLIPQGFSTFTSHNKVSHGLSIYGAHTNLPVRGPASTNLPTRSPTLRTCPSVLQHRWSTSYVPSHTLHLSSMSTKHTNLPHSYPHTRLTGYEPIRSYHHVLTTIHEPTRSWHNISWSTSASIRTNNAHKLH